MSCRSSSPWSTPELFPSSRSCSAAELVTGLRGWAGGRLHRRSAAQSGRGAALRRQRRKAARHLACATRSICPLLFWLMCGLMIGRRSSGRDHPPRRQDDLRGPTPRCQAVRGAAQGLWRGLYAIVRPGLRGRALVLPQASIRVMGPEPRSTRFISTRSRTSRRPDGRYIDSLRAQYRADVDIYSWPPTCTSTPSSRRRAARRAMPPLRVRRAQARRDAPRKRRRLTGVTGF